MSTKPYLLYLHGIGDGDPDDEWLKALECSLESVGYADLSSVDVIVPKYPNTLRGVDRPPPLPKVTIKPLHGDQARVHRRDFDRRRTSMEVRLGKVAPGEGWPGVPDNAAAPFLKFVSRANNYVKKSEVRASVLNMVLEDLPDSGRLVIVGHSLGSVIAADLLRRLPPDLEVAGLVTLGSPLAHPALHVDAIIDDLEDPPTNLAWWVNFRTAMDPVVAGRGIGLVLPWVLDQRLPGLNPAKAHFSSTYLQVDAVATAIGFALFGNRSSEVAIRDRGLDLPLTERETFALLALRYAHLIQDQLKGETRERYAEALRYSQSRTVEGLLQHNDRADGGVPNEVSELVIDLTDDTTEIPVPRAPRHPLSTDDAIAKLLLIANTNLIQPFEIKVGKNERKRAMEQLTLEMQHGTQLGADVMAALDEALDVVDGDTNWVKWAGIGVGTAAVVAATSGLALAAAPGVAGAAAVTSALAAFGPGGMIGGLVTAGTLMSAGGGGLAVGLAAPQTTVAEVEAFVVAQLAEAILTKKHGGWQSYPQWEILVDTETATQNQLNRVEAISDKSAASVKSLRQKLDGLRRAIAYMQREDLAPPTVTNSAL